MLICSSCLVLHFTINTSLNCCHPLSKLITFSLILFRLFLFSQPLVTERQSKCVFPPLSPQRDWVFSNRVCCFYLLISQGMLENGKAHSQLESFPLAVDASRHVLHQTCNSLNLKTKSCFCNFIIPQLRVVFVDGIKNKLCYRGIRFVAGIATIEASRRQNTSKASLDLLQIKFYWRLLKNRKLEHVVFTLQFAYILVQD